MNMDQFVNTLDAFISDYFSLSLPDIHPTDVVEVLIIAALFYELAYMIGYEPKLISGSIYGTQTQFRSEEGKRIEAHAGFRPYAWVEIKYDGIWYIFDPAGESQFDTYRMYYKRNEPLRWQRGYRADVF